MSDGPLTFSAKKHIEDRINKIHILLIINSPRAADLVKRLFLNLGFTNIYIANDTAEGLQYLRRIQLHLIVTDSELKVARKVSNQASMMKEQDSVQLSGIQFVHRLRYSPSSPTPFIPVIMMMDHAMSSEIAKARDAGVNEIILKPLEAKNFCQRIIDLVDKPRIYITASAYRGPCRRRKPGKPPLASERRVREVRLVRCNETRRQA